jgi:hypothetical protein
MLNDVMENEGLSNVTDELQADLVGQIWQYTLALEQYVVKLRKEVNRLSGATSEHPYPDEESDFRVRFFSDHPAYEIFAVELSEEETGWTLPN